jgi:hypothetical protein
LVHLITSLTLQDLTPYEKFVAEDMASTQWTVAEKSISNDREKRRIDTATLHI